jgi:beta-lactamase regulating signal transducer with metallopeptidase domain
MPIVKQGEWKWMGKRTMGVTIFPFIFLRKSYCDKQPKRELDVLIRHESIHIAQQKELLVIFFYVWYFLEWFIKFFKYSFLAYREISFEREAYYNELSENYLQNRRFWSFLKYL